MQSTSAAEPPPVPHGPWIWARRNLFSSVGNTAITLVCIAVLVAILLPLSVPTTPLTILAVVLSVAVAGGVYAVSAAEVKRLGERRGLLVESRFLLWGAVGLMMLTVGAIALSVASETRR